MCDYYLNFGSLASRGIVRAHLFAYAVFAHANKNNDNHEHRDAYTRDQFLIRAPQRRHTPPHENMRREHE